MSSIGRFLKRALDAIRARRSSQGLELGPSPVKTWHTKWFNKWAAAQRQRLLEDWHNHTLATRKSVAPLPPQSTPKVKPPPPPPSRGNRA